MNTNRRRDALDSALRKALELRQRGRQRAAVAMLRPFHPQIHKAAYGAGIMATIHFEMGDFVNAAKWYARATSLAPRSEHGSLGLFHSLWEMGRHKDALKEARRFLKSTASNQYSLILWELLDGGGISPQPRLEVLAKLSLDDRFAVNMAERAGLQWREEARHFTPFAELQHA